MKCMRVTNHSVNNKAMVTLLSGRKYFLKYLKREHLRWNHD